MDRLFEVKNAFHLGNFQQCINEAQKLATRSDEEKIAKETYMYRSYILQNKPGIVLSEIPASTSVPELKAIRRYAEAQNPAKAGQIVSQVEAEVQSGLTDEISIVIAATILLDAGNLEEAFRAACQSESLEAKALVIHTLLAMDRVDLAVKELKKMCEMDEDATLTQLSVAWLNIFLGKDKLQEAFYIYQEMMDKYGPTPYLLVGQSQALINQGKYEEAEKLLQEAQSRDPNYPEANVNLIHVNDHLGRAPEVSIRLLSQIKDSHPNHPFVVDYLKAEVAIAECY